MNDNNSENVKKIFQETKEKKKKLEQFYENFNEKEIEILINAKKIINNEEQDKFKDQNYNNILVKEKVISYFLADNNKNILDKFEQELNETLSIINNFQKIQEDFNNFSKKDNLLEKVLLLQNLQNQQFLLAEKYFDSKFVKHLKKNTDIYHREILSDFENIQLIKFYNENQKELIFYSNEIDVFFNNLSGVYKKIFFQIFQKKITLFLESKILKEIIFSDELWCICLINSSYLKENYLFPFEKLVFDNEKFEINDKTDFFHLIDKIFEIISKNISIHNSIIKYFLQESEKIEKIPIFYNNLIQRFLSKISSKIIDPIIRTHLAEFINISEKKYNIESNWSDFFKNVQLRAVLDESSSLILEIKSGFYIKMRDILKENNFNYQDLISFLNEKMIKLINLYQLIHEKIGPEIFLEGMEVILQLLVVLCEEKENKKFDFYNIILTILSNLQKNIWKLLELSNIKINNELKTRIFKITRFISEFERNYLDKFMNESEFSK